MELAEQLEKVSTGDLPSQELANWAYDNWWILTEGELRWDESREATLLRDLLNDIAGQWEIQIGSAFASGGLRAVAVQEFPEDLLQAWSSRLTGWRDSEE